MEWTISERPTTLDGVAGCESLKNLVRTCATTKKWPHYFLLTGKYGSGKTTMAKIIAQTMVCKDLDENGNPCGVCKDCKSIIDETFGRDVKMIGAESLKKGEGGGDSLMDSVKNLVDKAKTQPVFGDKKVIIFEEIQQLVSQNDKTNPINALLKLMENPNSKTYFIFTSMAALPKSGFTSRCMQFTFPEPSHTDILKYLYNASKKIEYEGVPVLQYLLNEPKAGEKFCKEGFLEIAKASDYSYRNALMALQECVMTKMFDIDSIAIRFGGINDENVIRLIKDIARNDKSEHVLKVMSLVDNTNYMKLYYIGSMIIREAESYKLFNKVMKKKTVKDEEGNPKEVYETLTDGAFEVTQARELSESPNFERLKKVIESFAFCNLPSKDLLMTKLLSCYS